MPWHAFENKHTNVRRYFLQVTPKLLNNDLRSNDIDANSLFKSLWPNRENGSKRIVLNAM